MTQDIVMPSFGRDKILYISQFIIPANKLGVALHNKNVLNLFHGLNDNARRNLTKILDRLNRFADRSTKHLSEVYNEEEMHEYAYYAKFVNEIKILGTICEYKQFKLPCNNFEASVFLYQHGVNTLKTLNNIDEKAIIDVGGFIADSVLVFRDLCPVNSIYSFEPNNENYKIACNTLKINNLSGGGGVFIENFALGAAEGEGRISATADAAARILNENSVQGQYTKIDTLDNYVTTHNIKVGLIKVDVEGYEQNFLRGALETIKTQKPILLLSIYHNYDDFYKIKPIIEDLNLGYKFNFFKGIDDRICADIMLLCEVY
ncbi:MAG: FkbM family methyltransferase [Desulfovibrio sp.]|jgi:FkbM family methyltransferase|nr:FkbM family methyltransferase [Desulfovibrio sp.]